MTGAAVFSFLRVFFRTGCATSAGFGFCFAFRGLDTLGVALDFFGAVLDDFAGVLASFVAFADLLTAAFVLFFRRVAFAGLLDELPAG